MNDFDNWGLTGAFEKLAGLDLTNKYLSGIDNSIFKQAELATKNLPGINTSAIDQIVIAKSAGLIPELQSNWLTKTKPAWIQALEAKPAWIKALEAKPTWIKALETKPAWSDVLNIKGISSLEKSFGLKFDLLEKSNFKSTFSEVTALKKAFSATNSHFIHIGKIESELHKSEIFAFAKQFSGLSSFKALERLNNSPFSHLGIELTESLEVPSIIDRSIIEADNDVSEELENCTDYKLLSNKAKRLLSYIFHVYFVTVFLNSLTSITFIMYEQEIRDLVKPFTSKSEVKKITKTIPSYFDKNMLKGLRIPTKNRLLLRAKPIMKADVLEELSFGNLLKTIQCDEAKKNNKSWLHVQVEIDGEIIEGWVLRRYTAYFK